MKTIAILCILIISFSLYSQREFKLTFSVEVYGSSWDYYTRFNPNVGKPDITSKILFGNKIIDTHFNPDNKNNVFYSKKFYSKGIDSITLSFSDRDEGNLNVLNSDDFIGSFKIVVSDTSKDFNFEFKNDAFKISGNVEFIKNYTLTLKSIDLSFIKLDDRDKKIRKKDFKNMEISLYNGYKIIEKTPLVVSSQDKFKIIINHTFQFSDYSYSSSKYRIVFYNETTNRSIEFSFELSPYRVTVISEKTRKSTEALEVYLSH